MNVRIKNRLQFKVQSSGGFTLIEVLVAVSIFAIVMFIIYGTFTTSSNHAAIIEERADEVSSVVGTLDTMSREIRGAYLHPEGAMRNFSGKGGSITFVTTAPYVRDGEPYIQRVTYIFEQGDLKRKTVYLVPEGFNRGMDMGKEGKEEFLLLKDTRGASFSFFDGKGWVDEWTSDIRLPYGVRVVFSYKDRDIKNIIPVWSRM